MDEARLIEKLRKIEALFAGTTNKGERNAAELARQRVLERLEKLVTEDPPVEYKFTMADMWSRKVFVALLRRYGLFPYRYKGQRYTTVMVHVPVRFVEETLWPEFTQISEQLEVYLGEVTDRVVTQVLHEDSSEPVVHERGQNPPMMSLPLLLEEMQAKEETQDSPQTPPTNTDKSTTKSPGARRRGKKKKKKGRKRR